MNNKEVIAELSGRLGYTQKDTARLLEATVGIMARQLQEGNAVAVQGFGTFEIRKRLERISVNPATGQRMLVPPRLVLVYKPGSALKDKFR